MKGFLRTISSSVVAGAVAGFIFLGIGGRIMMRIVAHWEGRTPVLTSGTMTVLLMGTVAGIAGGLVHGLLRQFVRSYAVRATVFVLFCILFTLYGVHDLLMRPRMLFVAITILYCIGVTLAMGRKSAGRQ